MASFTQEQGDYIGAGGSKQVLRVRGPLVVAAEGAAVGDIPASLFGLTRIIDCGIAVKDDNTTLEVFAPDSTGSSLLAVSLIQATDANRNKIADLTGTYYITVTGE